LDSKRVIWQLDWVSVDNDDIARVDSGSEVGKSPSVEELIAIGVVEIEDNVEEFAVVDGSRCVKNSPCEVRNVWINLNVNWLTNCNTINEDSEGFKSGRHVGGCVDGVDVLCTGRVPAEEPVGLV
jgi:hypothetical protein